MGVAQALTTQYSAFVFGWLVAAPCASVAVLGLPVWLQGTVTWAVEALTCPIAACGALVLADRTSGGEGAISSNYASTSDMADVSKAREYNGGDSRDLNDSGTLDFNTVVERQERTRKRKERAAKLKAAMDADAKAAEAKAAAERANVQAATPETGVDNGVRDSSPSLDSGAGVGTAAAQPSTIADRIRAGNLFSSSGLQSVNSFEVRRCSLCGCLTDAASHTSYACVCTQHEHDILAGRRSPAATAELSNALASAAADHVTPRKFSAGGRSRDSGQGRRASDGSSRSISPASRRRSGHSAATTTGSHASLQQSPRYSPPGQTVGVHSRYVSGYRVGRTVAGGDANPAPALVSKGNGAGAGASGAEVAAASGAVGRGQGSQAAARPGSRGSTGMRPISSHGPPRARSTRRFPGVRRAVRRGNQAPRESFLGQVRCGAGCLSLSWVLC